MSNFTEAYKHRWVDQGRTESVRNNVKDTCTSSPSQEPTARPTHSIHFLPRRGLEAVASTGRRGSISAMIPSIVSLLSAEDSAPPPFLPLARHSWSSAALSSSRFRRSDATPLSPLFGEGWNTPSRSDFRSSAMERFGGTNPELAMGRTARSSAVTNDIVHGLDKARIVGETV